MSYKITQKTLLISIFIGFVSTIFTGLQIVKLNNEKTHDYYSLMSQRTYIRIQQKENELDINNYGFSPLPNVEEELAEIAKILGTPSKPSPFVLYSLYLLLFALILGNLYLIYIFLNNNSVLVNNTKYKLQENSIQFLPEEYINDLETFRERLKRQQLSDEEIEIKITLLVLNMLRGYLICQLQNLWLDRNKIE